MPGLFQRKAHVVRHLGQPCLLLQRQPRLCKQHVDVQHRFIAVGEHGLQPSYLAGKRDQNPFNFSLLLAAQLHNSGVGLHNGGGLHKDGRTGGTDIVNHAANVAAVLRLDRHHIAAVSQRHHGLLQIPAGGLVAHDHIQLIPDGVLRSPDFAPQIKQGVAGGVRHFLRRKDCIGDLFFQTGLGGQRIEQIVRRQHVVVAQPIPGNQILKVAQGSCHHQQFAHGKHTALYRTAHNFIHAFHAAKPGAAVL